ncbi:probable calcium-binding protein CML22 [Lolium rigidum]|uniref:probable calcium-binding protein CML22 n=1 Tax=Lolium rigidum TaxID=89674 RepID=UPI001F5DE59D|nr:probable calcium-binding protein CML22 [Lolium rigidum]
MDMELASSSAPGASYFNFSVAQAVVTISVNVILVWLSAVIKSSSSSSSSAGRRSAASAPEPEPTPAPAKDSSDSEVDLDVVLGLMGASGAASVGFEEATALFEEEEATVEEAAAAFRVFDCNGDGFIDAGELGSVLRSLGFTAGVAAADWQRMIDAYDGDKDGRMDFQEFLAFMERSSSS